MLFVLRLELCGVCSGEGTIPRSSCPGGTGTLRVLSEGTRASFMPAPPHCRGSGKSGCHGSGSCVEVGGRGWHGGTVSRVTPPQATRCVGPTFPRCQLLLAKSPSPSPGLSPEAVGGAAGFRIARPQLDPSGTRAEEQRWHWQESCGSWKQLFEGRCPRGRASAELSSSAELKAQTSPF